MFLHVSVSHCVHGGVSVTACTTCHMIDDRGSLSRRGVSVQEGGLCPRGFCPRGLFLGGFPVQVGSLSRLGLFPGDVSVQGVSLSSGVSVLEGLCQGGLYQGDSPRQRPAGTVTSMQYGNERAVRVRILLECILVITDKIKSDIFPVYRSRKEIEFRPVENLDRVLYTLSVDPDQPYVLCSETVITSVGFNISSPLELLYHNVQKKSHTVHRVNCGTRPPTLQFEINIAHEDQGKVLCMCISRDLLVITRGHEGVFCYTLVEGNMMWKVSGKLPEMEWGIDARGVTADEQGHLFVCDKENSCVHELFAGDGKHLGVVLREGQEGVGKLYNAAFHEDSASMVVAHGNEPDAACCSLSIFSCRHVDSEATSQTCLQN